MDPKIIKLKTVSQLNDTDKTYIREHPTEFTDEDRSAWAGAFNSSDEPAGGGEGTDPAPAGTGDEPVDPPADPVDPAPTDPAPAAAVDPTTGFQFKNAEEAQEFVKKEFEKQKQAAVDAATTPEAKKYVEENWKPKNWQEGIKTAAEAAADIIQERQKEEAKRIQAHNAKVEVEWQDLRKAHKLKDITDPDGQKVHDAIIAIGTKYGKKNFKDAYEVYKTIPVEFGGAYKPKATEPAPADPAPADPAPAPAAAKTTVAAAKKVATKIGGQNSGNAPAAGGSGVIKPPTYEDLQTKSKSKLIKEALAA